VLPKGKQVVRLFAFGALFAMLGFTYALATSSRSTDAEAGVSSRVVGSGALRFMAPVILDQADPLPDTFDLGDACFGTAITRYITVAGGVRPYRMSAANLVPPLIAPNSTITLGVSGWLSGSIAVATVPPLNFSVTAVDATGTVPQSVTGNFQINVMICPPGTFRFAVDRINNAILGQHYVAKLETLGGNQPVRFSVLPGTLTVNGIAKGVVGGLEAIGLSLADDGPMTAPFSAGHWKWARSVSPPAPPTA
jgi:hypothetical protein